MSSNSRRKPPFFRRHYEHLLELALLPLLAVLLLSTHVDGTDRAAQTANSVQRGQAAEGLSATQVLLYGCAGAALLGAAASFPLLHSRHSGARAAGVILLWAALAFLAGCYVQYRLRSGRQFWGLPAKDVVLVYGTMVADSRPDGRGGLRGRIRLEAVQDRFGTTAEASGVVQVRFQGPGQGREALGQEPTPGRGTMGLFQGRKISIPAKVIPLDRSAGVPPQSAVSCVTGGICKVHTKGQWQCADYTCGIMHTRAVFIKQLRRHLQSVGRTAPPLLQALLLGYRKDGSGGVAALFRRAGCAHLLALSGMHLGVLSVGLLIVLTPVIGRRPALVLSFLVICAYLFLVGPRPSMLRAVLMYGLGVAAAIFLGLRLPAHYLVAVTFLLHVVLLPQDFRTLGFRLSYTALYGICIWTPIVSRCLPAVLPRWLRNVAAATISAQCSTAFLVVKSFGVVYPVGFVTPLVLTPLVTLWMWCGLTYLAWSMLISLVPAIFAFSTTAPLLVGIDRIFRYGLEQAAEFTIAVVRWCSRFRPVEIPEENWWVTGLVALALLTLFMLTQYAGRYVRRIKLQLSKVDRPVSAGEWNGPNPPLWAELSDFTGGAREDSAAA